jgi:predicted NAD/FAD-dependent oxidoreductase
MSAIPKTMARKRTLTLNKPVRSLTRSPSGWRISFTDGSSEGGFPAVVLAVPAEQAVHLLTGIADRLAEEAAAARSAPCWATLFAFEGGGEPAFGALRIEDGGPLAWLARTADGQGWVAHASPAWSRLNLEMAAEAVVFGLEAAVRRALPEVGPTVVAQAHRWRFAQVETPASTPFSWDEDALIGVCGDWRVGPSVESAWRSGRALAAAIVSSRAALDEDAMGAPATET